MRQKLGALVRHLEQKSGSDLRRLTKDWSWMVIGKLVGSVTSILLAAAYAHYLTQEEYGTYKYVLAVFGVISIFTLRGMEDASQRSIARGYEGTFLQTFYVRLKFGVITVLLGCLIGLYYLFKENEILGLIFLTSAPLLLFTNTLTHYNTLLLGRHLFKKISFNNTYIQLLSSAAILFAIIYTQSVSIIVLTYLLSFFILYGFSFLQTIKTLRPNKKIDPEGIKYGKHVSLTNLINTVASQVSPLLLWHLTGPTELAIYSFSLAAVNEFRGIMKLITTNIAFPKFSSTSTEIIKKTLLRKVLFAHSITVPTTLILAMLIPIIYQTLFPNYIESIIYAQVMILLLAFFPMRFYGTAVMAKAAPQTMYITNLSTILLQTSTLVLFVPFFDIWGIIISQALTQLVSNIIVFYFFKKL